MVDRIIIQRGVEVRFAVPRIVEIRRIGAINPMVPKDVG
jgi:hypothetical protein